MEHGLNTDESEGGLVELAPQSYGRCISGEALCERGLSNLSL